MSAKGARPDVSIIIPVYNEEALLFGAVVELIERMRDFELDYEILVCENGSQDATRELAFALERKYPQVRALTSDEPNYGKALRNGIEQAHGTWVVCEEVDILDSDFHHRSLDALRADQCDFVVGSKLHPDSQDHRPFLRHVASHVITYMLRLSLDFRGTDTHGLKAFHRDRVLPVVRKCIVDRDLFASELVIRAQREGLRVLELPVEIREKRTPSVNLVKRVPHVLKNLAELVVAIRLKS